MKRPRIKFDLSRLKKHVRSLSCSNRATNCLICNRIYSIGQLICVKRSDLITIQNFGKKSLFEIESALINIGLSLAPETSKFNAKWVDKFIGNIK